MLVFIVSFFLIASTGGSIAACIIAMTSNGKPEVFISLIIPLVLGVAFYCVGRNIDIYVIINISYTLGTITIEKKECFTVITNKKLYK